MKKTELIKIAKAGKIAELRKRLREIEKLVISSPRPERQLRSEAVIILGLLDG